MSATPGEQGFAWTKEKAGSIPCRWTDEKAKGRRETQQVLKKTEKKEKNYKKKFKILARKIAKLQRDGKRRPDKKKKFTDYTKPHQSRLRQQMKENCQATLSFLGLYDFIATKVEVFNGETQQYETFSLIDQNELPLKGQWVNGADRWKFGWR